MESITRNSGKQKSSEDDRMHKDLSPVVMEEKIGCGANGAVYRGIYKDKKVAIKVISGEKQSTLDDEDYRSFIKEGKLMLKLCSRKHKHFVQVHAICICRENSAIIMEYADLGTLLEVLRKGPLSLNVQFNLVIGIAKGIQFLHKQDIIHRDIAARNILLNSEMVPMISDFGLSRVVTDDNYSSTGKHSLPLKWMSPEAIKSNNFSKSTDIWSFGIVVWEIVTEGEEPHKDISVMEAKIQIRDYFLAPIIPPETDPTMKVIMTQCWYKDPDMRPSPRDIIDLAKERDL